MAGTPARESEPWIGSWVAAVIAVAATYGYFLIFAEFAFLEWVRAVDARPERLRLVMAGLGAGGIGGAALGAWRFRRESGRSQLAWTLRLCGLAALVTLAADAWGALVAVAVAVGLALGALTVILAAVLRGAAGPARLGTAVGAGTGLAYAGCNLPMVFQASPRDQTVLAALLVWGASIAPRWMASRDDGPVEPETAAPAVARWVVLLLALVWMDSAAFYIVQHTPALRAVTWGGAWALYANAGVHLVAAFGAGIALDLGWRGRVVAAATVLLAGACLMLEGLLPSFVPAVWLYAAGVSFYSAVLVEYPARSGRAGIAAAVFAVAGWMGSALGIGMAQDLAHVPPRFVGVATFVIAAMLIWRGKRAAVVVLALAVATGADGGRLAAAESDFQVVRGREVYIAEGCLHCHSQYVRPEVALDGERWGPAAALADALAAQPPLFGNRRQGPDLANVGNRRSPEWNRLHLQRPREVSPGTRMPSYSHLFAVGDDRGEALVAYLASLGADTVAARQAQIAAWRPRPDHVTEPAAAARLFARWCVPCHGGSGRADGPLAGKLSVRPADWATAPFRHVPKGSDIELVLSRIIKFGLPGLPMAGREYLPDADVVGLARHVQALQKTAGRASVVPDQP
jgi:cytochrome c oxidase cbb3-type subunit 2